MLEHLICEAIRGRKLMMYAYGGLIRVVEPHLLGETGARDPILSGWLRPGYSRSDPHGGWRTWRVDRISDAQILDAQFAGPRPGYNPADPRMVRVACALPAAALAPGSESLPPHAPDDGGPDAIEPAREGAAH